VITADDFTFLRRAIDIAATAITTGDDPYGSLLAGPRGEILIEAHNTVRRDGDPGTAARTTMYTSCQPCEMCAGAIARSGLGRVVYALSTEQWAQLNPGFAWPTVPSDGPALFDEARVPIDRYHRPQTPPGPGGGLG